MGEKPAARKSTYDSLNEQTLTKISQSIGSNEKPSDTKTSTFEGQFSAVKSSAASTTSTYATVESQSGEKSCEKVVQSSTEQSERKTSTKSLTKVTQSYASQPAETLN